MSGAVCPACGVAVVPGYVRCPKCHRPLPRFARNTTSPVGGTTLEQRKRGTPVIPIAIALLVGGGFIAAFALRAGTPSSAAAVPTRPVATPPVVAPPAPPTATAAGSTAPAAPPQARPNAGVLAASLQRALQRQELWSSVSAIGARLEVQSHACADPKLKTAIDGVAASFKAAGLTHVRCVEQSGAVAFDREL